MFINPVSAYSNEMLGFRIGSTIDEARSAARQIKRQLEDINLGGSPDYALFAVSPNGPQLGFCHGKMVSMTFDMSGSFHEFVHSFEKNQRDYGQPQTRTSQSYAGGMQLSSLNLEWSKPDGVMKTLSVWNWGGEKLKTTEGFFKPNPCSP